MNEQVTAQEIILGIIENMHASLEPLVDTAIAPGLYHVYLRRADYERLKGIFPEVISEARKKLDQEIEELNKSSRPSMFDRLFGRPSDNSTIIHTKPKDGWNILFNVDDDLPEGERYKVEVLLVLPAKPDYEGGSQTIRVTTTKSASEIFSQVFPQKPPSNSEQRPSASVARAFARISFEDNTGRQVYTMDKQQIVIGRGGVAHWVDLKLHTLSDVSHEHLRLRYDEAAKEFYLKDVSTFGTTINGETVTSSIEMKDGAKQDKNIREKIPPKARIGLAEVLFLDFEALEVS